MKLRQEKDESFYAVQCTFTGLFEQTPDSNQVFAEPWHSPRLYSAQSTAAHLLNY